MKRLAQILLLCYMVTLLMGADSKDDRFERLGAKIMCTCGCSEMLLKCNHVGCQSSDPMIRQLRALTGSGRVIATGAASSSSVETANLKPMSDDQEILNWFRTNWGVTAVVEPGTHGLELWAWILPAAALALGLVAVAFTIRSWRLRRATAPARPPKLDAHLEALRDRARRETEI